MTINMRTNKLEMILLFIFLIILTNYFTLNKTLSEFHENNKLKINRDKFLISYPNHNPCYLKGYFNYTSNIIGTGDYHKCYELLINFLKSNHTELKVNNNSNADKDLNKTILLDSQFRDIADHFKVRSITFNFLKKEAEKICNLNYTEIPKTNHFLRMKYTLLIQNFNPNICLKLTYTQILLEEIFHPGDQNEIVFSTNSGLNENDILLNKAVFKFERVPVGIIILYCFLSILFISGIFVKNYISQFIFYLTYENFDGEYKEENLEEIKSTITSLPVQNFIFKKFLDKIKIFTHRENFISLNDYRVFFISL
jgi:hypothetical protein